MSVCASMYEENISENFSPFVRRCVPEARGMSLYVYVHPLVAITRTPKVVVVVVFIDQNPRQ